MIATGRARKGRFLLGGGLLALLTLWIYRPCLRGNWLWDDREEVANNPQIRDPQGVAALWTRPIGRDYLPLKATVQWVQWQLWGDRRMGYHLTNLALHLVSAVLVGVILARRGEPEGAAAGWIGAALFLVHPLAVESVAWISELKNALALPLQLGACWVWLRFKGRGGAWAYGTALSIFAASLLAKGSGVMLPVVALAYAWWSKGRVRGRDVLELAPFFVLALALGAVTVQFQEHRAIQGEDLKIGGMAERLAAAGWAIWFYLGKCLWPARVMPLYDWPDLFRQPAWGVLAWGGLALWIGWLAMRRTSWSRAALFGLAWFGLNLVPVLGIIPMAYLRISWVADHLVYLPMVGLVGLAAAGAAKIWQAGKRVSPALGWTAALAGLAVLAILALRSRAYASAYRTSDGFWQYAIRENPRAWLAYNNLAETWVDDPRRLREAAAAAKDAVSLKPDLPDAHLNLGLALGRLGEPQEAEDEFRTALRLRPRYPEADQDLGMVLAAQGRAVQAVACYREALRWRPFFPDVRRALGTALAGLGRTDEAVAEFQTALRLAPHDAATHYAFAEVLERLPGRTDEARREFEETLRLDPSSAEAHNELGVWFAERGDWGRARTHWTAALALRPDYADAQRNLAVLNRLRPASK